MKIAVTAAGPSLDAALDPRFGRCSCFMLVETDNMGFEALDNSNMALRGGAGIQSAQVMAARGVKAVLTGSCGPNAYDTLSAAGIQVIVGCEGTVTEAVELFKAGKLQSATEPNAVPHSGMVQPGAKSR